MFYCYKTLYILFYGTSKVESCLTFIVTGSDLYKTGLCRANLTLGEVLLDNYILIFTEY